MMKKFTILMILAFIVVITGCSNNKVGLIQETLLIKSDGNELLDEEEDIENFIEDISEVEINLEEIKPNENGQIMVLMYHGIGNEESEWVRTSENFKKDLEILYNNGFRLLSISDYVDNNIDIEAGYTPVVLTFDDGLQNQFNYIDEDSNVSIDPNCAVGILEDFCKGHPDFGRTATFYVYYPIPFRQKNFIEKKYKFLFDNGYEIGNHGYNHENLSSISIEKVQESLAKNASETAKILKGYEVQSLALPYGAAPKGDNYEYVVSGEHDGFSYHNKAVLKVGSNPAYSPNHIKFDASRIPRVRGSEMKVQGTGLYDYLSYFEKNPEKKYISDGNKNVITIPESELDNINLESLDGKELVTYDLNFQQN